MYFHLQNAFSSKQHLFKPKLQPHFPQATHNTLICSNLAQKFKKPIKTHENMFLTPTSKNICMMPFSFSKPLQNSPMHSSQLCLHTHKISKPNPQKKMKMRFHLFLTECTKKPHIHHLHHPNTPNMGFKHISTSKNSTKWMKT